MHDLNYTNEAKGFSSTRPFLSHFRQSGPRSRSSNEHNDLVDMTIDAGAARPWPGGAKRWAQGVRF